MAQWGKNDQASQSVNWAPTLVKVTPNTANRDALYGNTTANAFIAGVTVGQYGVDDAEIAAGAGKVAHTGWVLQTTGQGGRAGRVFTEVLVAGGITGDGEDVSYPDYRITISSQPAAASANGSNNDVATFSVTAATVPAGGTISYLWQANSGSGFVNAAAGTSGNTTATLSVNANTASNGTQYRVVTSVTGGANVTSSAAVLTVTT